MLQKTAMNKHSNKDINNAINASVTHCNVQLTEASHLIEKISTQKGPKSGKKKPVTGIRTIEKVRKIKEGL